LTTTSTTEILRRTDQNEIIVGTDGSKGAAPSIAESSEQTLDPIAASPFNLPDLDDRGLEMIDISKVTTAKILDKRLSQSGVEYKCELGPLWWKRRRWDAFISRGTRPDLYERDVSIH
jgi:hypothetical protein